MDFNAYVICESEDIPRVWTFRDNTKHRTFSGCGSHDDSGSLGTPLSPKKEDMGFLWASVSAHVKGTEHLEGLRSI